MAGKNPRKVITNEVRASYVHIFEPYASFEGGDKKHSLVILVPKSDQATIDKIRAAQKVALEEGKSSKFNGSIPKNWKNTFRDGDDLDEDELEKNPEKAGHWFMTISNKQRPGIVDRAMNKLEDHTSIQSGDYVRVGMTAFAFNTQGNKGVSFGLDNVQLLRKGEPLGGVSRAEDDFDALEEDAEGEDML